MNIGVYMEFNAGVPLAWSTGAGSGRYYWENPAGVGLRGFKSHPPHQKHEVFLMCGVNSDPTY